MSTVHDVNFTSTPPTTDRYQQRLDDSLGFQALLQLLQSRSHILPAALGSVVGARRRLASASASTVEHH